MNTQRLLDLYDRVAEAPDAIPRMRRFVLDLAVRGMLVKQISTDETPAKSLAKTRRELKTWAENTKRMKWRRTDPVTDDELNKPLPSGWVAARVNDTGLYINGLAFKPTDWKTAGMPIIRIQNLTDSTKEFNYADGDFPEEVMVRRGDILVSWSATLEAFKWDRAEGVLNQHIFRVLPHTALVDSDFLYLLLRHAIREMADSEYAHGLVMTHINRGPFLNHIVLIPPLAEQRRIAAKAEQMMTLLDRLEAAQNKREDIRKQLTTATFARITAADTDSETYRSHRKLFLDNFTAFTTRPEQIKALRQTILDLAVRGKLTQQDPADEPAAALLKRIAAEKARLVKAGKLRKPKKLPPVEDAPFALPTNWCWTRIREVTSDRGQQVPDGDFTYIDVTAINKEAGVVAKPKVLTKDDEAPSRARKITTQGDVLYSCVRPYLLNVAVIEQVYAPAPIASTAFAVLNGHGLVLDWYIWTVLRSSFMVECVEEKQRGQAYPAINDRDFSLLPFPLPPLAEQHRIVARVRQAMSMADRLQAALTTAATIRSRLLESLLHEALAPA